MANFTFNTSKEH